MDDETYEVVWVAVQTGMTAVSQVFQPYPDLREVLIAGPPGFVTLEVDLRSDQLRVARITPAGQPTESYYTPDLARKRLRELVS